jgi:2-hydroxychromene-2-carboxylate isomerase
VATRSDAIKADLRVRTERAVELGIFGAPSFVEGGILHWGQDRMHFVVGARQEDVLPPLPPRAKGHGRALDVYWDFSSPYAYLGATQVEALAQRTDARVTWKPMLLGGLFKAVGQPNVPMQTWSDAKRAFLFADLTRWAKYYGVPFAWPTRFPMNSLKAMRAYLAIGDEAVRTRFRDATFRAYWGEDRDIADDAELRALLVGAGADADANFAKSATPEGKQALVTATEEAVRAGVFGAPTFVVDDRELFWGQDRIPLVERALVTPPAAE